MCSIFRNQGTPFCLDDASFWFVLFNQLLPVLALYGILIIFNISWIFNRYEYIFHTLHIHVYKIPQEHCVFVLFNLTLPDLGWGLLSRFLPFGYFPNFHEDVIKWKHFPRYWPFVRGIHRSPVNSPHKGQWRGALMFTLICARINGWVNNR